MVGVPAIYFLALWIQKVGVISVPCGKLIPRADSFLKILYFWLHWVFVAVCRLFSSCSEQELLSSWGAKASHCGGFSCCRAGTLGQADSVVVECMLSSCSSWAPKLRLNSYNTGLVAPRLVGFPWTRDRTLISCIGRWLLNHWTTREVPGS